jgi:hypothetical protein
MLPRFKPGDVVYKVYETVVSGPHTITSEPIRDMWNNAPIFTPTVPYYYMLTLNSSAWDDHLVPADVFNSPLYKLLKEE